jgi:hypothetical protein
MPIKSWMSWHDGVDLVAATAPNLPMPNLLFHVARTVHTPIGSAPAGMIFFQPDTNAAPQVMGFISPNIEIAKYFGPHIFAGTPFENAPALQATIDITASAESASARIAVANFLFETKLTGLKPAELITRPPGGATPFTQQGVEAPAASATLSANGTQLHILVPAVGISGGPAAVYAPTGLYAR